MHLNDELNIPSKSNPFFQEFHFIQHQSLSNHPDFLTMSNIIKFYQIYSRALK